MKKIMLLLSFGLFSFITISQETISESYTILYTDDFIEIQANEGLFTESSTNKSHLRYFLKYINKSSEAIEFSFVRSTTYQGDCTTCPINPSESQYEINLSPNETITFSEENSDKRFYVFVKDNNRLIKNQLLNFEIKNINYSNKK